MTLGNGVVESTSFNVRLQPTAITIGPATSPLLALGYSYCSNVAASDCIDNNGNLQFQTIAIGPGSGTYRWQQRYAYDPFNRLTGATESKLAGAENLTSGWSQTYAFDPYGNRALVSAGSYTPGNNDTSALPTVLKAATPVGTIYNGNNQWIGATHDRHGNLTAMAGRYQLGYDLDDLMTTSIVSGVATSYQYDADGRRVAKQSGSKSTIFVYDASGQLAAEYSQNEPAAPSLVTYLSNDHLGSTRLRTSKEGTVIGRYDYLPFGDELSQMDNLRPSSQGYPDGFYPNNATTVESSRLEFTGKERDAETGLDYFGSRYMSSAMGRFTSVDPIVVSKQRLIDPQGLNLYAYTRNNPLRYVDPNGEDLTIVYSYGPDISKSQKQFFEQNKSAIFAAITKKFKEAGVDKVIFKDAQSLSKADLQKLANSPVGPDQRTTGIPGVARLEVTGETSSIRRFQPRAGTVGATAHGLSDVFLTRLGSDSSPSCDRVCTFANVAAHEIGHGLGFDDPGHTLAPFGTGFFSGISVPDAIRRARGGQPDIMMQGQDPTDRSYNFNMQNDKNIRAVQEVNRVGGYPR